MLYYTKEKIISKLSTLNAGTKARDDIKVILEKNGWEPIELVIVRDESENGKNGKIRKMKEHLDIAKGMDNVFQKLYSGDTLLIQFPFLSHTIFGGSVLRKLKARGVKVTLLVHDLEIIRFALESGSYLRKLRINLEEKSLLKESTSIIVHNERMKKTLMEMGIDAQKMINLEIFDYLIPNYDISAKKKSTSKDMPIIVAGNLRENKAGYLYHLSDTQEYNLYGIGYEPKKQNPALYYIGAFQPDELPKELKGSFGLIWDGDETKTCSGVFGSYLRINNPHKTSLYLASGIPVVIWKKAALARFIIKNGCGIVVNSLEEIPSAIAKISDDEYRKMQEKTVAISNRLRDGYYTITALEQI